MCLAYMPGSYAQYQLSVYASELIQSFGLTTSQFSSLFTAPMIVAIFLSFVGGMISDKVGSKKVINISFVIAGIGMIGRVFANSYMRQQRRQFCLIAGHLLLLYQQYSVLVYLFYGCFL